VSLCLRIVTEESIAVSLSLSLSLPLSLSLSLSLSLRIVIDKKSLSDCGREG